MQCPHSTRHLYHKIKDRETFRLQQFANTYSCWLHFTGRAVWLSDAVASSVLSHKTLWKMSSCIRSGEMKYVHPPHLTVIVETQHHNLEPERQRVSVLTSIKSAMIKGTSEGYYGLYWIIFPFSLLTECTAVTSVKLCPCSFTLKRLMRSYLVSNS